MAASHWLTNRGKQLLMQGAWDDAGATAIRMGLLSSASGTVPTSMDTEAEIQDIATVSALLALSGVTEVTGGSYARQNLSRTNATQDDTNNWSALDTADVVFTALPAGTSVYGGFWYDATTDTNDTTRQLMGVFILASAIPLNGSNVTITVADLVHAV